MLVRGLQAATIVLLGVALAFVREPAAAPAAMPSPTFADATPELRQPDAPRTIAPAATPVAIETLRIKIARLGIDLPLAYGDLQRDVPHNAFAGNTPENEALVFPGSAPLASGGNTYIYAHARVGMFLTLWDAHVGDEVVIYGPNDLVRLRYLISEIFPRVSPSDTHWLDPGPPERLTLQTSTGPTPSDPRFIAIALPVSLSAVSSPAR